MKFEKILATIFLGIFFFYSNFNTMNIEQIRPGGDIESYESIDEPTGQMRPGDDIESYESIDEPTGQMRSDLESVVGQEKINEFFGFASQKNLSSIEEFLKENIDFDLASKDSEGNTILHKACENNNLPLVRFLISKNFDINVKNNAGLTPLHVAAEKKLIVVIKELRFAGADVSIRNNQNQTPFEYVFDTYFRGKYLNFVGTLQEEEAKKLSAFFSLLSRENPRDLFLLTLLREKVIRKCTLLIDETEIVDSNWDGGAMHYSLGIALMGENPIIVSRRLLFSTLFSAFNRTNVINNSLSSLENNPIGFLLKNPLTGLDRFNYINIIKNDFFASNWAICSERDDSDYFLLIPKGKNPKDLGFSKKLRENRTVKEIIENRDISSLGWFLSHIRNIEFNKDKLEQIKRMFGATGWVIFLVGHGGYKYSTGGMQNELFSNQLMKFFSEDLKILTLVVMSCFSGGENLEIFKKNIEKIGIKKRNFFILVLSAVDEAVSTYSPAIEGPDKLEHNLHSKTQLFPFYLDFNFNIFINKISNFFSIPIQMSEKLFVNKVSRFYNDSFFKPGILSYREFISFLLPWSETILGFDDLDKAKFITPMEIKAKLFESRYLERSASKRVVEISIDEKEFIILSENEVNIKFRIRGTIPQFILNKRNPETYNYKYHFKNISLENIEGLGAQDIEDKKIFFIKEFVRKAFLKNAGFNKKTIEVDRLEIGDLIYENVLVDQTSGIVNYNGSSIQALNQRELLKLNASLKKEFFWEADLGNIGDVKRLIGTGVDINSKNVLGETLLHIFCSSDTPNIEFLGFLLDKGADISLQDNRGFTVLHHLCNRVKPDLKALSFLINKGADVNAVDTAGNTPLHIICGIENPSVEVIEFLVNHGADAKKQNIYGMTPIDFAENFKEANSKVLKYLNSL